MAPTDTVAVTVRGHLRRGDSDDPVVATGTIPAGATVVTKPGEPHRRFVVLAESRGAGRPFFRCGTDEIHASTLQSVYGTKDEPPAKRQCTVKKEEEEDVK